MASQSPMETLHTTPATMQLPAPTVWPIVLAFGLTLIFAGLVTSISVSILGAVLALAGTVGWFRDILPHEAHETVPVSGKVEPVVTTRPEVARVGWITHEHHRANRGISLGFFRHRCGRPPVHLSDRRPPLRRDASHVSAPPDSSGRPRRATPP